MDWGWLVKTCPRRALRLLLRTSLLLICGFDDCVKLVCLSPRASAHASSQGQAGLVNAHAGLLFSFRWAHSNDSDVSTSGPTGTSGQTQSLAIIIPTFRRQDRRQRLDSNSRIICNANHADGNVWTDGNVWNMQLSFAMVVGIARGAVAFCDGCCVFLTSAMPLSRCALFCAISIGL